MGAAKAAAALTAIVLALIGCGPESATSLLPATLAGCAEMDVAAERENCRLLLLTPLFEQGNQLDFEIGLASLEDPLSRDLVRLRLAVLFPARAGTLCERVETPGAEQKCRQVLGRPHLRAPP
jgi:hypothetical protein